MTWSCNLAYVIGLITTDGNLSKDGRHINLTSKDLDQIQNFKHLLGLQNKIGIKRSSKTNTKDYYRIQFGDVKFYKFLVSIGLFPNKSKILREILVPNEYFSDFLRGYFDGDGFSYSYWDKRWRSSFLFYMGFVSASGYHLKWLKTKIQKLYNISGTIKFSKKSIYQLTYAKTSSLSLVKKLYYQDDLVCLERKKFKIQATLDIISNHADVAKLVDAQS